jgi:hypothetical protein
MTAALTTFNVASAAGAGASLLRMLAILGTSLAAGAAAYKLMDGALGSTTKSFTVALPPVQQYINAQTELTTRLRGTTKEYIAQQEALLSQVTQEQTALQTNIKTKLDMIKAWEDLGAMSKEGIDKMSAAKGLKDDEERYRALTDRVNAARTALDALYRIMAKQNALEDNPKRNTDDDTTARQLLAIKNANDTVKELTASYNAMFKAPAARDWAILQNDINRQVENFRDSLTRTELPAAKVTELTNKYADALRKVREGEYQLRTQVSYFQVVESLFSKGIDRALDSFVDSIMRGEDALKALEDTARQVVADIFKTFMTLAALNPIKNALFGTNYTTLGGSAGIGGLLGGMFGGGGGELPNWGTPSFVGPTLAKGGILGPGGLMPLHKYAGGGIAHSPQLALFGEGKGPEAFVPLPDGRSIPVSMKGQGSTEIHIHEAPGVSASVKTSRGKNGQQRHDIFLKDMIKGVLMEDIAKGGEMSETMERQYGLNRTVGLGR